MPVPKLMARSPLYDSMSCAVSGNRIRLARQLIGGFREGFRVPRIGMQGAGRGDWHGGSDQTPLLTELRTPQRSKKTQNRGDNSIREVGGENLNLLTSPAKEGPTSGQQRPGF